MILLDTRACSNPRYPLQRAMRGAALAALADADVILYLVDATEGTATLSPTLAQARASRSARRSSLALNKIDLLTAARRAELLRRQFPTRSSISATHRRRRRRAPRSASRRCFPRARFSIRRTRSARRRCASSSAS